ncbi:hypothetical protein [Desulfovibrio sp. ZJ200]|uniref:hypothetical protein n=1 Tax=Desulfovibrio sp. ZJ200 TaxID=2709792 RepID=UPI0013EBB0E3|nr:hypothetical protein [Desulfovibrio sp. ZJ200]
MTHYRIRRGAAASSFSPRAFLHGPALPETGRNAFFPARIERFADEIRAFC